MRPLLLASASPRRRQLLALTGWPFEVRAVNADETPLPGEAPEVFVQRMSTLKAALAWEAWAAAPTPGAAPLIIASDTTVVLAGELLNKPADAAEAVAMLTRLRGRAHTVLTALTILEADTRRAHTDLAASQVPMRDYTDAELHAYVATGDPLDKAGAYAIQHPHFQPVARADFAACFANVMGLPLCHLLRRLRTLGLEAQADVPAACQAFIPYHCPVYDGILNGPP